MTDAETIIARVYAAEKCWNAHREGGVCWACDYCEEARHLAAEVARALRDAALLPEATVRVQWGIRVGPPEPSTWAMRAAQIDSGVLLGTHDLFTEETARAAAVHGDPVVRRTRTTYADHVTEWEPAE